MSTSIITSEKSINHLTGDGHPEQPKRVVSITEKLKTVFKNGLRLTKVAERIQPEDRRVLPLTDPHA